MFESVLERNLPPRQIGRGAGLALGVHAVIVVAAVWLSARPTRVIEKEMGPIAIFSPPRLVQTGIPDAKEGAPATRPRTEHRPWRWVPTDIDKGRKRTEESSSSAVTGDSNRTTAEPGTAADGPGVPGGGGESVGTGRAGGTTIAIPFGEGMTRPSLLAQSAPVYTREASAAHAEGTVSVRCTITVEGTLKNCRILKGVPFMDGAVLDALSRWKYTPVTFQGRPVSVYYAINIRLIAP